MSSEAAAKTEQQTATGWRNRIVDNLVMSVSELRPNGKNWRVHPRQQAGALRSTLEEVGLVQSVILNRRSVEQGWPPEAVPTLVDGHLRVELAVQNREESLPVCVVDLTSPEEALVLATLDPLGAMAEADPEILAALLGDVPAQNDTDMLALLDLLAEQAGIEAPVEPPGEDPGPQLDRADELREKWGTERGQLWVIPSNTAPDTQLVTCPHCGSADTAQAAK